MIHFFRRIRQGLLSQNRFSKYMLYAVGEILLVVIGILIALYINNANNNRQKQKEIVTLFEKTLVELNGNIERCDNKIRFYKLRDSIYHLKIS